MIVDMVMQTEDARQLVYRAADMVDGVIAGKEVAPFAAMAKCFASDVAMKVATDAMQLFGAAGISARNTRSTVFSATPRSYRLSKELIRSSATLSPILWAEPRRREIIGQRLWPNTT